MFRVLPVSALCRRLVTDKAVYSGIRTLFSGGYLAMDGFIEARESRKRSMGPMTENFMTRMRQQIDKNENTMVFTEDLKTVMFLAENKEEDLELCTKMINKFQSQNKELRFGTFVFGPVVMRMLYHLKKADLMLHYIMDENSGVFFDQIRSYLLVMDLLYEMERYQDVLDVNERLVSRQLIDTKFPRDNLLLVIAACYKMNTPESCNYTLDIVTKSRTAGSYLIRRALHFAIGLCLNQGKPDVAMEFLSNLTTSNHVTNNNLKIITYAKLGRIPDALNILQRKVDFDYPDQAFIRGNICQESLNAVEEAISAAGNTELSHNFEQLVQSLHKISAITSQSIDDLLSSPIEPRREQPDQSQPERFQRRRQGFLFDKRRPQLQPRQRVFNSISSEV